MFYSAILIVVLSRNVAEKYGKQIVKLLFCDIFDVDIVLDQLRSVTSSNVLVVKKSLNNLETKKF